MADASFFVRKKPYGTEQITVSTAAVPLTAALVNNTGTTATGTNANYWAVRFPASAAIVEAKTNGVYYTLDGSTPSATNGLNLNAGDVLTLAGRNQVAGLKMIRNSGSDATVNVSYFKE